jgi:hypothetical protein
VANWGDTLWEDLLKLRETDGMPIEPGPLELRCQHCKDAYPVEDEDRRYPGLCLGCREYFADLDRQDELIQAHDNRPSNLL